MRGLWIVVALVACHHADAPAPVAPKGPAACARASDSLVQAMLARLPAKDGPPTDEADALRNLIRERCEHDAWSAEATRCLIAVKQLSDAEPCAQLMTEGQQAALVRDEQARFGGPVEAPPPVPPVAAPAADPAPEAAPAPAAVSAPAAQPAPPPPPAPAPAKRAKPAKSKGKSTGGDPCSGGE